MPAEVKRRLVARFRCFWLFFVGRARSRSPLLPPRVAGDRLRLAEFFASFFPDDPSLSLGDFFQEMLLSRRFLDSFISEKSSPCVSGDVDFSFEIPCLEDL